jgi:pimeloyl-ACP methyl ester carboxylesterase
MPLLQLRGRRLSASALATSRHRATAYTVGPNKWSAPLRTGLLATAVLATSAVLIRHRARQAEYKHPPTGTFLEVDGVRLHYLDRGKGTPVILLHGNGVMARDFEASGLVERLSPRYRVLAFDRPGFGYSARPRGRLWTPEAQAMLLHHAWEQLGIELPLIVGHSWGTLVALALALNPAVAVRGLVLLSGYFFPTARADVPVMAVPALPGVGDVMRYTVSPLLGRLTGPRLIRKMFAPRPVPASFPAAMPLALMLRPWQIRASAEDTAFMIPAAAAFQPRYPELVLPVTIMAGANDQVIDGRRQSAQLHGTLPQSTLRVLPGVGHMLHYAVPEQVVEVIDAVTSTCHRIPMT